METGLKKFHQTNAAKLASHLRIQVARKPEQHYAAEKVPISAKTLCTEDFLTALHIEFYFRNEHVT